MAHEPQRYQQRLAQPVDWKGTERYEVVGCLGRGGMGVVYEAYDRQRRQPVALKTLQHFDASALYLFKQEFRILADVHHPNLVRLYELVVPDSERVFFTMELVRGKDFREHVRDADLERSSSPPTAVLTVRQAVSRGNVDPAGPAPANDGTDALRPCPANLDRLRPALRQLVDGVHALHAAGKLHRDIKPSNVLVADDGRVVLLDFGVAAELSSAQGPREGSGEMVGTARYMAPEQSLDEPVGPASDWYSVGVMLYEALVGRPPFAGTVVDLLMMKNTLEAAPPSSSVQGVPPDLDALCTGLLQRQPHLRPTGPEILRRLGAEDSGALAVSGGRAKASAQFVGREGHLQALRDAFNASRSGGAIAVRVSGASGMGKSTVVHHFLDGLEERAEALVLRGRAYERESVPYKAVDAVVDSLTRHLLGLDEAGRRPPLPEDMWALGQLFPVLQQVSSGRGAPEGGAEDPQGLRRRAFAALAAVLRSLVATKPLVIFVDDAQWGDVDSAVLLLDLFRSGSALPMLLVLTHRDEAADEAATGSPFLVALREQWPDGAEVRDVAVGPLAPEDATRLAVALLAVDGDLARRTARAVARESRGSPFLVEELVRSNRGLTPADGPTLEVLTLDRMVSQRLDGLPPEARLLLEIVSVAGRPLPVHVVAAASSVREGADQIIAMVADRRFLRTGLRGGRDTVETTHDRIRETIVAQLSAGTLREHHARLARVLEETPDVDAEAIAMHWLGAGENDRAGRFARRAAEQAAGKLAFDQAARLFRLALDNARLSSPEVRSVRGRLAAVLVSAGRATESARVYLDLAEGASPRHQLECRRAAAEQLLAAGRIDEGEEILRGVLSAVEMAAPRSPLATVFWLIVYRLWVAVLGLRFKERDPDEVSPQDRLRVDALYTVATGFATVNIILGACMQAHHFAVAIRKGHRLQVLRALAHEAAHVAAQGKKESRRERRLVEVSRALAKRIGTEEALAQFEGAWGIGLFMRGLWKSANESLRLEGAPATVRSNTALVRLFLARTYFFLGDPKECIAREARLYAEACDRGDLLTTVNMRTSTYVRKWLAADEPDRARRDVREALADWSQAGFLVQHWQAMVYAPDIDLYVGDGAAAYEQFIREMPALKRSFLLHSGFIRALTYYTHGRVAIGSIESRPELRDKRVAEARRMARLLDREANPWAGALAALVDAVAENAAGDRPAALVALRLAIDRAEKTDCVSFALPARHCLGELLGGDDGRLMVDDALRTMAEWGIRNPSRWLAVYMPGQWKAAPKAAAAE